MSDSGSDVTSRRALLTGGIAGLAALVANAVLRPLPAAAAGNVLLGELNDSGSSGTTLQSTNGSQALMGHNTNYGYGVSGVSDKTGGVFGMGLETGVQGRALGPDSTAVHGFKNSSTGPAVMGENSLASNGYAAVYGVTNGTGPAVYGEGLAAGNGTSGVAKGTGSGIYGQSDNGRGGRFRGKKAQIRLEPATTTTHPAAGDAGDLYLDKSKRLWLCKGGTTWVRILTS